MDVSENSGTPKSSTLIGCSIINHPFWGTPIFGNTQIVYLTTSVGPCSKILVYFCKFDLSIQNPSILRVSPNKMAQAVNFIKTSYLRPLVAFMEIIFICVKEPTTW